MAVGDAGPRQTDRLSHNPEAASSAAMATNRYLFFIVSYFLSSASNSLSPHCARFAGVGFRFGTKAGNSGAKRQQAGMNCTGNIFELTVALMRYVRLPPG